MKSWIKFTLLNLLIVCFLGVIMRYKIAFSLPFVDQKYLLHAHSHFAFAGWISQMLMIFMVINLVNKGVYDAFKKFNPVLILNAICAYGMLLSFPFQGYGTVSISFSTLSIFVFITFSIQYFKALNLYKNDPETKWFKASLILYLLSAVGTFTLAYMMMNGINEQRVYLSSVYFYLHFQYNGWFLFAAMGLFIPYLRTLKVSDKFLNKLFWIWFACSFPGYFLSVLWLPIPMLLYWIIVIAATLPLIFWFILLKHIHSGKMLSIVFSKNSLWIFKLVALACSIKLFLQFGSVIPQLSKLSYTYRPIIIGYLHLILLGIFTLFLLAYLVEIKILTVTKTAINGIRIFIAGVILNELVLMLQGGTYMSYISLPYMNETLLFVALLMFTGLFIMLFAFSRDKKVVSP